MDNLPQRGLSKWSSFREVPFSGSPVGQHSFSLSYTHKCLVEARPASLARVRSFMSMCGSLSCPP